MVLLRFLAVIPGLCVSALSVQECDASGKCRGVAEADKEAKAPSMLMMEAKIFRDRAVLLDDAEDASVAEKTCAPLMLSGFQTTGCAGLLPGQSCEVSCTEGLSGSVRYFCFSALAAAGKPPAGVRLPMCYNATGSPFTQGKEMPLAWGSKGCLKCTGAYKKCDLVSEGDDCTTFKLDLANNNMVTWSQGSNMCLDMFSGPRLGLWRCVNGDHQGFFVEPSSTWHGTKELCVTSWRGKICLRPLGVPVKFFDQPIDASLLKPALDDLAAGDSKAALSRAYAMQVCRARLESSVPDSFWDWLKTQDLGVFQALFSTFPVHPGQIKIFHEIRELVGHGKFDEMGMASFAVALSYVNRMKGSIDEAVQMLAPGFEINDAGFLRHETDRVKQEMIDGKHCGIQSNECKNLHKCCGPPEQWNFTWPRDPTPSVKEWVEFWLKTLADHPEQVWKNPVKEVPWMYAAYIWPSPVEECEWVHSKLIDGNEMEGSWYLYDTYFHSRICAGGNYHPDSLPGMAVYGGVCGRMAMLESRKSGCMGMPATTKGEPGHCAGYKYTSATAVFTALNVITDVSMFSTLKVVPEKHDYVTFEFVKFDDAFPNITTSCLKCPAWRTCEVLPASSGDCSKFTVDKESGRLRATYPDQCLSLGWGAKPGNWRCVTSPNQDFYENANGDLVIKSDRGQIRFRATKVPQEPYVDECLVCKKRQACGRALPHSADCTRFVLDEDTGLLKAPEVGQCLAMHHGPKIGLWSCITTDSNQKTTSTVEGYRRITSSRGQLTFERFKVAGDTSERGRCLSCTRSYGECSFSDAGSEDCTVFQYDPKTKLIGTGTSGMVKNQCLELSKGLKPGLGRCTDNAHMKATPDEQGRLVISGSRGTLHLHVPNNGTLPNSKTKWQFSGFHELGCTRKNCHFWSLMGLDSRTLFQKSHKEAALAALESFNDYEHNGIFPTAHDEARLAASIAFTLHKEGGATNEDIAPVLAWALKRNPAMYEAWELAANLPAGGPLNASGVPKRDTLASREWYKTLSLLRVDGADAKGQEGADRFAHEHLVKHKRWLQFPQLHRSLVGRLCGALSEGVLEELGEASEECMLVRQLAAGYSWKETEEDMAYADTQGTGNLPSEAFQTRWEALARLAMAPGQHGQSEKLKTLTEHLLDSLTVGYVNSRSQTFFAEHGRLRLRSPYAHALQLAGAVLPRARREEILKSTKMVLEQPVKAPERLWASTEVSTEGFLEWLSGHGVSKETVFQESSVTDTVNGGSALDLPNPDVYDELKLDQDALLERGAVFWHDTVKDEPRFNTASLLRTLLRLEGEGGDSPGETDEDYLLSARPALMQQKVTKEAQARAETPTSSALLQMCMDDIFVLAEAKMTR